MLEEYKESSVDEMASAYQISAHIHEIENALDLLCRENGILITHARKLDQ